jgi:hypothetical protein
MQWSVCGVPCWCNIETIDVAVQAGAWHVLKDVGMEEACREAAALC